MKNFKNLNQIFFTVMLIIFLHSGANLLATETIVVIKGLTAVLPIVQSCAEVFMDKNPKISISVQGGGSGVGIASLIDDTCNNADASRPIIDKEVATAKEKGINPATNIVARDAIAVAVHPSNGIDGLTLGQIKAIYTGEISSWSELGGSDQSIVVISRDSASGTFETFNEFALDGKKFRPDALLQASNSAVANTAANTPGTIGYIGLGYVSGKVKAISVDNVMPSKETINSGEYSLARTLFMYTNGEPKGAVKKYLDFVISEEGKKLVEENSFISLK